MNIKGGCYCGEIRYESKGEVHASLQCHCRECQYITGGNSNVIMIMPLEGFKFVSGKPKEFKSEQDPQLSFSFSGTQNTSRAGTPVPIVYGEIITGSVVISGAIDTQQLQA